jgi:hypothetical protein
VAVIESGCVSKVVLNRNAVQLGISVHRLVWAQSEGGVIFGVDCTVICWVSQSGIGIVCTFPYLSKVAC